MGKTREVQVEDIRTKGQRARLEADKQRALKAKDAKMPKKKFSTT